MPLTQFQAEVFKIISRNRNPDSYVVGGIVIHRDATSSRYSDDIDLFHDTSQAVIASAELDAEALGKSGYEIRFLIQEPTFYQASVTRQGEGIRLDWAADSAFRFFPIVPDEVLGFRLHDADDTPQMIMQELRRNSRINPVSMEGVTLAYPQNPVALKTEWLDRFAAAEALMNSFPPDPLGCLYLNKNGQPAQGQTFDPAWVPHYGSVKGAWPKISNLARLSGDRS